MWEKSSIFNIYSYYDVIQIIVNFILAVKNQFLDNYIYDFSFIRGLEILMLIMGFVYIHLMIKENHYAWLIAAFNCLVLIYIWGSKGIFGQTFLYAFYVCNSLYAFFKWRKKDKDNNSIVKIKHLKLYISAIQVICLLLLTYVIVQIINYLKINYGLASNNTPLEVFIVICSIYGLLLQINKNVESWIYVVIVDFLVFLLYLRISLYILALIRGYITIMSLYGFIKWIVKYRKANLLNKSKID